jgi:hypothetical protein
VTYRKRIGYAKLGRSISFDRNKHGFQGDAEAPQLLIRLAERNPDVEWVVVGRNNSFDAAQMPSNVTNGWASKPRTGQALGLFEKLVPFIGGLDGMVMHAGQHGTSQMSIPQSHSTWKDFYADPMEHATTPQDWSISYGGFLVRGLNMLGDRTNGEAPVVWIVTDPRNYLKARDIKWPTGYDRILAQYEFTRDGRHERYQDPRTPDDFDKMNYQDMCTTDRDGEIWVAQHTYVYGGLELMILPDDWDTWGSASFADRLPAGIASTSFNDGRSGKEPRRSELIRDYLVNAFPDAPIYGKWDDVSLQDLPPGRVIQNDPQAFPELLNQWRVTLSLPALGSSWTVAKPYQCWAARVVTFLVDRVDDQGWILPSRRENAKTKQIGEVNGRPYYSIRDDWTDADIRLAHWLRVETPEEFTTRAQYVSENEAVWTSLMDAQSDLLARRWNEHTTERMIEQQLGLTTG